MRHMQVTPQSLAPGRCSEDWVQPETHEFSQAGCSHLLLSALYGMQSFLHLTNAGVVAPNRLELPADCTHTRPLLETRDSGLGRAGRGGGRGWEAGQGMGLGHSLLPSRALSASHLRTCRGPVAGLPGGRLATCWNALVFRWTGRRGSETGSRDPGGSSGESRAVPCRRGRGEEKPSARMWRN